MKRNAGGQRQKRGLAMGVRASLMALFAGLLLLVAVAAASAAGVAGTGRAEIVAAIEQAKEDLWRMSDWMYHNPEPGHHEQQAVAMLTGYLKDRGWNVEIGLNDVPEYWKPILKGSWNLDSLPTAWKATYPGQKDGPTIAFLVEYDALRGPGGQAFHGCQHNLQGPAGIGAAIAVAEALKEYDLPGKVIVIGTPAEEIPPPVKAIMYDAGWFDGVDVAIMFHGGTKTSRARTGPSGMALDAFEFVFHGKPAHAAALPWEGKSALDAVILMFNGIDALREHSDPGTRMHGIINDGGAAPNVVPERAATTWMIRHFDRQYLNQQTEKAFAIAKAAAMMTGTTVEIKPQGKYDNSLNLDTLEAISFKYGQEYGGTNVVPPDTCPPKTGASTDFGTVSFNIPAITVSVQSAPERTAGHSQQNADATIAEIGHNGMLIASKVMASLAWDLFTEPGLIAKTKDEHAKLRGN